MDFLSFDTISLCNFNISKKNSKRQKKINFSLIELWKFPQSFVPIKNVSSIFYEKNYERNPRALWEKNINIICLLLFFCKVDRIRIKNYWTTDNFVVISLNILKNRDRIKKFFQQKFFYVEWDFVIKNGNYAL